MRTARSRNSAGYLVTFAIAPSSQSPEPPGYPGRFKVIEGQQPGDVFGEAQVRTPTKGTEIWNPNGAGRSTGVLSLDGHRGAVENGSLQEFVSLRLIPRSICRRFGQPVAPVPRGADPIFESREFFFDGIAFKVCLDFYSEKPVLQLLVLLSRTQVVELIVGHANILGFEPSVYDLTHLP